MTVGDLFVVLYLGGVIVYLAHRWRLGDDEEVEDDARLEESGSGLDRAA